MHLHLIYLMIIPLLNDLFLLKGYSFTSVLLWSFTHP